MANPNAPKRPIPDDFAAKRAELKGMGKLSRHYRSSTRVVKRWIIEAGLPLLHSQPPPKKRRILPSDFASIAPTMTKNNLMEQYRASQLVIDRWLCEAGVSAKAPGKRGFSLPGFRLDIPPAARANPEDIAADHLRKWMPVHRCDERGRFALNGKWFRVGRSVLTPSEIIEKAEARHG